MIIEVYRQKCSTEEPIMRGLVKLTDENIVLRLNDVIDWENSKFPRKSEPYEPGKDPDQLKDLGEDREFLGESPVLAPGNCFMWDGSLFGIPSLNTIYLISTTTGAGVINRLEECINDEFEVKIMKIPEEYNFKVENYKVLPNLEDLERLPGNALRSQKLREVFSIELSEGIDRWKRLLIETDDIPLELTISKSGEILYDPEIFTSDSASYYAKLLTAWLIKQ